MLKSFLFVFASFLCISLVPTAQVHAAASIGRIVHTYGPAWIQRGATREKAEKGQVVLRNDSIVTGSRGRVKIIMGDGSKVYIGAKSRVSLRKYSLRGSKLLNASINMLWGKARFFVNKLTSRGSSFRVRTPTAVLGVRGTEFIVLIPPTPEVLAMAFDNITLDDIPPLPTSTILTEGAVDVTSGAAGGSIERLLPGHTAHVDKGGKVVIKETGKGDGEFKGVKPQRTPLKGSDSKNTEQQKPKLKDWFERPAHRKPFKRPNPSDLGGFEAPQIEPVPDSAANALQNLDNTTEIIIKPSFVE